MISDESRHVAHERCRGTRKHVKAEDCKDKCRCIWWKQNVGTRTLRWRVWVILESFSQSSLHWSSFLFCKSYAIPERYWNNVVMLDDCYPILLSRTFSYQVVICLFISYMMFCRYVLVFSLSLVLSLSLSVSLSLSFTLCLSLCPCLCLVNSALWVCSFVRIFEVRLSNTCISDRSDMIVILSF